MKNRSIFPFIALLTISEIVTASLFLTCLLFLHANPFGIYGNFIISLGGMIFGLLGPIGAYPGARIAGLAPSTRLAIVLVLANFAGLLLYHWLLYTIAAISGDAAAVTGGFSGFVDSVNGHAQFRMHPSDDTATDIGRMGYGLLLLDFAWTALGAFVVLGALRTIPHCHDCKTYYRSRGKHSVLFFDGDALSSATAHLPQTPQERADALMQLPQHRPVRASRGVIQLAMRRSECPSCREQSMIEDIEVHNGKGFVRVDGISYRWKPTQASRIEQAAPAAPRGGFGRKGLST